MDKRIWFTILFFFSAQSELRAVQNIVFFLYDLASKAWFFEKSIFEIETSYSFKITCILARQLIPLKKNGGVFGKIYFLILWYPICTPLIIVSASVKMAGTSATVMWNSMRVDTPGKLLI